MKFKVTMKDPDTLYDAVSDAVHEEVSRIPGLDNDEIEAVKSERKDKVKALCEKWFEYGEYLTVEIDTEAKTCMVVPK